MTKFVTYRDVDIDNNLQYFVLQKDFPHFVGMICPIPKIELVPAIAISNYNLWMVFNYTLRGKMIPSYKNIEQEILQVMSDMAEWYYENRILTEPKKFKKFKIEMYVPSPVQ